MPYMPPPNLFDSVRSWAYRNVGNYGDELTFMEATTDQAQHLNDRELHGRSEKEIARLGASVAAWAWARRDELAGKADVAQRPAATPLVEAASRPPTAELVPRQARGGSMNRAASARVATGNAALAWVKAELRSADRVEMLREKLDDALALGVGQDVLLDVVVEACKRYDVPPSRIPDDLRALLTGAGPGD